MVEVPPHGSSLAWLLAFAPPRLAMSCKLGSKLVKVTHGQYVVMGLQNACFAQKR